MKFRLLTIILSLLLLFADNSVYCRAEDPSPGEYVVKAAFLYNFAKFVEWPEQAFSDDNSPIILGILGEDPFREAIETIRGKAVRRRRLLVKKAARVEDLKGCHMIFISSSEKYKLPQVLKLLDGNNVLTIGDMEDFAKKGGIVNFIKDGNKVRFEINIDSAKAAGLKISSKLLKLAKIVETN